MQKKIEDSKQGDSSYQAYLRNRANKEWHVRFEGSDSVEQYLQIIKDELKPGMRILDVGCGTGHILKLLSHELKTISIEAIGLDASIDMIRYAGPDECDGGNFKWIVGCEDKVPLPDGSVDILLSRLSDYTASEIERLLVRGGLFFEYGLGPRDSEEIAKAFPDRFTCEYEPLTPELWLENRQSVLMEYDLDTVMFSIIEGFEYLDRQQLIDTILMVPLVEDFILPEDSQSLESMRVQSRNGTEEYRVLRQITLRKALKR